MQNATPITNVHQLNDAHFRYLEAHTRKGDPGECWQWTGPTDHSGYGRVSSRRNYKTISTGAHRAAYLVAHGVIPDGLVIDHLCHNRACVNPAHMEPVTNAENTSSARRATIKRTHCRWGHEVTPENTTVRATGLRHCRICQRDSLRRWRARQKIAT